MVTGGVLSPLRGSQGRWRLGVPRLRRAGARPPPWATICRPCRGSHQTGAASSLPVLPPKGSCVVPTGAPGKWGLCRPCRGFHQMGGLPSVALAGASTKGIGPRPAGSWRRADQWGKQPKSTLLPDAERVKTNSRRALALWPVSGWESGADNHHALSIERLSVGSIKSYGHAGLWLGRSAVLRMTRDSLAGGPRRGARFASHVKSCRLRSRITAAAAGWPPRLWVIRYSACREPPKRSMQRSGIVLHIRAAARAESQRRFGFNPR